MIFIAGVCVVVIVMLMVQLWVVVALSMIPLLVLFDRDVCVWGVDWPSGIFERGLGSKTPSESARIVEYKSCCFNCLDGLA